VASRVAARDGFVAHVGRRSLETARALADVKTWGPLLTGQMRRLGVDSVPITLFIAIFTGIVLSLLSSYIFTGSVPMYFVGTLVGKTVMMELGPVLTGMALAGRVGASIAAEIGTMKVTEQVDALETLAYDPNSYLVVPRVLAATLMFPVVTAFAMAVGVGAGWVTAITWSGSVAWRMPRKNPKAIIGRKPVMAGKLAFSLTCDSLLYSLPPSP